VEWLYELEEYPGDLEPKCGLWGAPRVVARTTGCVMANGFGGGTMICGDPPTEPGGDARMVMGRLCGSSVAKLALAIETGSNRSTWLCGTSR
jgi:hypothetical protein